MPGSDTNGYLRSDYATVLEQARVALEKGTPEIVDLKKVIRVILNAAGFEGMSDKSRKLITSAEAIGPDVVDFFDTWDERIQGSSLPDIYLTEFAARSAELRAAAENLAFTSNECDVSNPGMALAATFSESRDG